MTNDSWCLWVWCALREAFSDFTAWRRGRPIALVIQRPRLVYSVDSFGFDVPAAEAPTANGTVGGRAYSLLSRNNRDGDMMVIGIGRRSSPNGPVIIIIIRCSSIELSVRPVILQHDWRIYSVM